DLNQAIQWVEQSAQGRYFGRSYRGGGGVALPYRDSLSCFMMTLGNGGNDPTQKIGQTDSETAAGRCNPSARAS
ncbi:MAG TPA: hypothetical protein VLL06_07880, partial [Nitrospiraceae bacterium]|nr:hypothetical protein [Nitrospiraceae bacterium]